MNEPTCANCRYSIPSSDEFIYCENTKRTIDNSIQTAMQGVALVERYEGCGKHRWRDNEDELIGLVE